MVTMQDVDDEGIISTPSEKELGSRQAVEVSNQDQKTYSGSSDSSTVDWSPCQSPSTVEQNTPDTLPTCTEDKTLCPSPSPIPNNHSLILSPRALDQALGAVGLEGVESPVVDVSLSSEEGVGETDIEDTILSSTATTFTEVSSISTMSLPSSLPVDSANSSFKTDSMPPGSMEHQELDQGYATLSDQLDVRSDQHRASCESESKPGEDVNLAGRPDLQAQTDQQSDHCDLQPEDVVVTSVDEVRTTVAESDQDEWNGREVVLHQPAAAEEKLETNLGQKLENTGLPETGDLTQQPIREKCASIEQDEIRDLSQCYKDTESVHLLQGGEEPESVTPEPESRDTPAGVSELTQHEYTLSLIHI